MRSFKLTILFTLLSGFAGAQTFDTPVNFEDELVIQGTIEGSMEEGLPITYSEKGVVFLLTDASGAKDSVFYNKPIKHLGTSNKVLVIGSFKEKKFFASEVFTQSLTNEREATEMATVFRKEGRIYVVIIVFSILLAGLIFYLILVDRKVKKFEKE